MAEAGIVDLGCVSVKLPDDIVRIHIRQNDSEVLIAQRYQATLAVAFCEGHSFL